MTAAAIDVKQEVAIANRVLWVLGLCTRVTASLGHASLRLPDRSDRFLVKGRGYKMDALATMRPEDMILCDLDGNLVDGPPGASQCFEVKMHSWMSGVATLAAERAQGGQRVSAWAYAEASPARTGSSAWRTASAATPARSRMSRARPPSIASKPSSRWPLPACRWPRWSASHVARSMAA